MKTISMRVQITDEEHRLDDEETAKFVARSLSDSYLGARVTVRVGRWILARDGVLGPLAAAGGV